MNVGINTLVEFLHKKGIEVDANPNAKIEDEQYDILIAEFGKDKNIRREATETREKMHRRDEKRETVAIEGYELPEEEAPRKKVEKEVIETEIPNELKPHFNVVGSIDLDNLGKKKIEPKAQEEPEVKAEESAVNPVAEKPQATEEKQAPGTQVAETEKQPEPLKENEEEPETTAATDEPIEESTPPQKESITPAQTPETPETPEELPVEKASKEVAAEASDEEEAKRAALAPEAETTEPETAAVNSEERDGKDKVFRLPKNKLESNIVVKGSIDLDSINDRTR
ncbi:MAG: infB, partial [Proteiniphilum sp.]|nr:infB [Proteiniphilum sp.]